MYSFIEFVQFQCLLTVSFHAFFCQPQQSLSPFLTEAEVDPAINREQGLFSLPARFLEGNQSNFKEKGSESHLLKCKLVTVQFCFLKNNNNSQLTYPLPLKIA